MRSTKIVATIGPASRDPEVLERIVAAGMDVARLNFAHGDPDEHAETAARIRAASEKVGRVVAILGDLPGPKLRLGPVAGGVAELGRGTGVTLSQDQTEGTAERLPVAWKGLGELVDEGDVAYLADGAVRLRIKGVTDGEVNTEVEVGGSVASRQGINLPNLTVSLPAVSEDDLALVDAGLDMGLDFLALSFVRRREDLEPVREHLRARGRELPLIAKIEKPQAAANAEEIVEHADGVMIARGDLGIELPIEEVPLVQKRILAMAGRQATPTITATQMLESMVQSSRPTRAEVADVANAIFDGTDAVMLSQETAVGQVPGRGGGDDGLDRRDHRARAALRPLAGRARPAGQQPVPRDLLRGGGGRLPAGAEGDRLAHPDGHDGPPDLLLPSPCPGAGAVDAPATSCASAACCGGSRPR